MTTLGEYLDGALIRGVDDGIGAGAVGSLQATPKSGDLELPEGGKGPVGPQGPPAYDFVWRGELADEAALAAQRPQMKSHHLGHAWRVVDTESLVFWDGTTFVTFTDAFGARGTTGAVNTLTIGAVTTGAVGSALVVTITGSSPNQTLNLSIPRGGQGMKGKDGSPGPIVNAPDFDATVSRTQGMTPQWDVSIEKWRPAPWPGYRGPWSIGESSFSAGINAASASIVVATIPIPAIDTAWRPEVFGGILFKPNSDADVAFQLFLNARVGSATGPIVGQGLVNYFNIEQYARMQPFYGSANFNPGDLTATVPANTAITIYLVANRLGTGSYSYYQSGATAVVRARPVVAP